MFVLFETESTRIVCVNSNGRWKDAIFATLAATKACATRLSRAEKLVPEDHSIMELGEFRKIEKTELVRNLMTGAMVEQSVNTPRSCDVSSELYWTM